jgi:hypothetical protein
MEAPIPGLQQEEREQATTERSTLPDDLTERLLLAEGRDSCQPRPPEISPSAAAACSFHGRSRVGRAGPLSLAGEKCLAQLLDVGPHKKFYRDLQQYPESR